MENKDVIVIESSDDEDNVPNVGPYELILPGKPKAWPRPTFMAWLKKGKLMRRVFNPAAKESKVTREYIKNQLQQKYNITLDSFPLSPTGPVFLHVTYHRRLANTMFKKNQRENGLRSVIPSIFDAMKPDIDNLVKYLMDALTGVLYYDDAQVCEIIVRKHVAVEEPYEPYTGVKCGRLN